MAADSSYGSVNLKEYYAMHGNVIDVSLTLNVEQQTQRMVQELAMMSPDEFAKWLEKSKKEDEIRTSPYRRFIDF